MPLTGNDRYCYAGALVLNALTAPLPVEVTPSSTGSATASTSSEALDSPIVSSSRSALDQLIVSLKNESAPAEVRTNICVFFSQISRRGSGEGLQKLKEAARPILEELVHVHGQSMLGNAAKRVLDMWTVE